MGRIVPDRQRVTRLWQSWKGRLSVLVFLYTAIKPTIAFVRRVVEAVNELQTGFEIGVAVKTGAFWLYNIVPTWLNTIAMFGSAALIWHSLRTPQPSLPVLRVAESNALNSLVEPPAANIPDVRTAQSTDETDYQLESSDVDFRAVFQELPNESFHVVNPDRDHFNHVAWVVGFTNRRQYHCIVRARLIFKVRWGAKSPYTHRTVLNGAWLEGTGAAGVELADKETRYLILAVTKITAPTDWLSVEDHRSTIHHALGVEVRPLPLAAVTIEVTTTLYGGETKTFTFGANLKTLRALTDLTPKV
jgi:hypothetical protein